MQHPETRRFLAVCLNPVIQKTLVFDGLAIDHVNRAVAQRTDASGKGVNVARVLAQTGRGAVHLTQAGGPDRDWFLALCAEDGLDVRWVESGSEVRFCTTVIDRAARTATELVEEGKPVAPGTEALLMDAFDAALGECRMFVFSGTKAAGFSGKVVPEMARRAAEAGVPAILDIKGADLENSLQWRPLVVKPNLHELLATRPAARGADLRAHVAAVAAEWKERFGTELVVTRGHEPIWFMEYGALAEEPVVPVESLNPTGSGDSFTAGLAAALAEGATLREAVREGAKMGALNATRLKPGSVLPDLP